MLIQLESMCSGMLQCTVCSGSVISMTPSRLTPVAPTKPPKIAPTGAAEREEEEEDAPPVDAAPLELAGRWAVLGNGALQTTVLRPMGIQVGGRGRRWGAQAQFKLHSNPPGLDRRVATTHAW